jgi:hypothetical protein
VNCPHCHNEVAPGTPVCPHCRGVVMAMPAGPSDAPSARAARPVAMASLIAGIACMGMGLIGTILRQVLPPTYGSAGTLVRLLLGLMPPLWTPGPALIAIGWSVLAILKAIFWEAQPAALPVAPARPSQYP